MKDLYELTFKKEILNEVAWGIMADFYKCKRQTGENLLSQTIYKHFAKKLNNLSKMNETEVEKFDEIVEFFNQVFQEIEVE